MKRPGVTGMKDGKWGYMDEKEKVAIEPQYAPFVSGYGARGFVVQRYAADDFAPVAYTTVKGKGKGKLWPDMNHWIQVLKVPAEKAP